VNAPEHTEEDHDDPELAAEGDIQTDYSSDWLYSQTIGAVTKNYL
jgi:hypothetical protein